MANAPPHPQSPGTSLWPGAILAALGTLCAALSLQTILSDYALAGTLVSRPLWSQIVALLGGRLSPVGGGTTAVDVSFGSLFIIALVAAVACWLAGAAALALKTKSPFRSQLAAWGRRGFAWWLLPGAWLVLWTAASIAGWDSAQNVLASTPQLWLAISLAGFAATFLAMTSNRDEIGTGRRIPLSVWLAAALYVVVFTSMNWQLYRGLLLPHGDSAMYEEHLWNLEHGKGFRSYLDPGLFLGEHIQVIHVALIPLHLVWPSQMLLELCESLALASGAIAVFWIARRHTGSDRAGALLAFAYLLYFPMQFLDIAIDLKTFRPIAFGVPLMLFAIDQMERGRYAGMLLLLLCALSAKEDYSIVIAPLGLWLLCRGGKRIEPDSVSKIEPDSVSPQATPSGRNRIVGGAMALFGVGYLLLVLLVLIPAFRQGHDPHYTGYFGWMHELAAEEETGRVERGRGGEREETIEPDSASPNGLAESGSIFGIVRAMIAHPSAWLGRLFSARSLFYALLLLVPAGCLALLSPGRLAVAAPLFGVLCLMELSGGAAGDAGFPLVPFHHFHAPLVPILFWATAAGLSVVTPQGIDPVSPFPKLRHSKFGFVSPLLELKRGGFRISDLTTVWFRHFAWTSAAACGLFFSLGPLGIPFWDAGSQWHWRSLYVPGERAERFRAVLELIPRTARVASTDLLHPRFTHHERSYDYSKYPRAVNDNKPGAPTDTDYIVIDKQARYSDISRPDQVQEYREHPDRWQLLLDDDYFIVLKRTK